MSEDVSSTSLWRLAEMWCLNELTADEYFAEIDRRAPLVVEAMIRDERNYDPE